MAIVIIVVARCTMVAARAARPLFYEASDKIAGGSDDNDGDYNSLHDDGPFL